VTVRLSNVSLLRGSIFTNVRLGRSEINVKGIFFATKHYSVDRGSSPEVSDVEHH
jgi:hypothetical protein